MHYRDFKKKAQKVDKKQHTIHLHPFKAFSLEEKVGLR
jgi:hypothetical protein